jgi:hypothetical protein
VNDIGNFSGEEALPDGAFLLPITADGNVDGDAHLTVAAAQSPTILLMAPLGVLGQARVTAEASLPRDWQLIGVWRDQDAPGEWMAVASGPHQPADMVTGKGGQPHTALQRLADLLRELRGSMSG